jgi:hypothetical protein
MAWEQRVTAELGAEVSSIALDILFFLWLISL